MANKSSHKIPVNPAYKKKIIPKAIREQVWIKYVGKQFEVKCPINWCENKISVFDFHVGHNIPESKGGKTDIENLRPICSRCNLSMGNQYTIIEWVKMGSSSQQTEQQTEQKVIPEVTKPNKRWPWCC